MLQKAYLKRNILAVMRSAGLRHLLALCVPARVAILRYHSIQDNPQEFANTIGAGIIHSTEVFAKQMEMVARHFVPVSMDDVLRIARGEKSIPGRAVAVTFDDGFADNFELAMPILNRVGVSATFYATVGFIETGRQPWYCRLRHAFGTTKRTTWFDSAGNITHNLGDPQSRNEAFRAASRRCAARMACEQEQVLESIERELQVEPLPAETSLMMSWDQLRGLRKSGHIVGSHTVTHPNLACVSPQEVYRECWESKVRLEKELNAPVKHFSYPSPIMQPHWNQQSVEITAKAGYHCAVTSSFGTVRAGNDPLSLGRVTVPGDLPQFEWVIECVFLGREI
jgi:peptidoglycan/xylan/chitin deacetylase (PgdA/CDA1 family)